MDRLYLSFWDLALSNFPAGTFRKRMLSNAEARGLITEARAAGALVCVADADLAAPYGEREREKHRQLCEAPRPPYARRRRHPARGRGLVPRGPDR